MRGGLYPKAGGMTTSPGGATSGVFPDRANARFQAVARMPGKGLREGRELACYMG